MNEKSAAVKHFTSELERAVNESTVRSIKKQYIQVSKQAKADETILTHGNCDHLCHKFSLQIRDLGIIHN